MTHFAGKAARVLVLSTILTVLLAASAAAADLAVGVGATTGSSLRMRSAPSTASSVITTLDKHVPVAVLGQEKDGWYHVSYDGKTGYISSDYLVLDQNNQFSAFGKVNADGVAVRSAASLSGKTLAVVNRGTEVDVTGFQDGWYAVTCEYGTKGYIRSDYLNLSEEVSSSGQAVVDLAKKYLGTPYVYGGASPRGFDCSGFTMYVYGQFNQSLPHTATGQWQSGAGSKVYSISALQPGDLVFFNDPSRNAGKACSHAGIYMGGNQFIHASSSHNGGVKTSSLSSGYYNQYFVGGLHVL